MVKGPSATYDTFCGEDGGQAFWPPTPALPPGLRKPDLILGFSEVLEEGDSAKTGMKRWESQFLGLSVRGQGLS